MSYRRACFELSGSHSAANSSLISQSEEDTRLLWRLFLLEELTAQLFENQWKGKLVFPRQDVLFFPRAVISIYVIVTQPLTEEFVLGSQSILQQTNISALSYRDIASVLFIPHT